MKLKKLRTYLTLVLLLSITTTYSQEISLNDSPFITRFIKSKTLSKLQRKTAVNPDKNSKLVYFRLKLKSKNGEKNAFDPNPFSLVVKDIKQRIRPIEIDYPIVHLNTSISNNSPLIFQAALAP